MTFNEYKEEIKNAFVKMWKDAGRDVQNPDDIFEYTPDEIVKEMYDKNMSAQEAMFACALRSTQFKKPRK